VLVEVFNQEPFSIKFLVNTLLGAVKSYKTSYNSPSGDPHSSAATAPLFPSFTLSFVFSFTLSLSSARFCLVTLTI